ncbi:MAG TPA: hypothetical protein VLG37_04810 [Candidatus Saccharimonadales bacterium]|nr:hypothetical protein [Candidatus Saccharimonadales bacterium]
MAKSSVRYSTPRQDLEILEDRLFKNQLETARIHPLETKRGLVAVKADEHLFGVVLAQVVVVDDYTVTVGHHAVNFRLGQTAHASSEERYYSCYIDAARADQPGGLDYQWAANDPNSQDPLRNEQLMVADILNNVTNSGSAYDALHQDFVRRYPSIDRGGLPPGAGMEYGPGVNLIRMLGVGVKFHPAVIEAALELPQREELS